MRLGLLLLVSILPAALPAAQSIFDAQANRWTIVGAQTGIALQLTESGAFIAEWLTDNQSGDRWDGFNQRSAPIRLQAGNEVYDTDRMYELVDHSAALLTNASGVRQTIVLQDLQKTAQFTVV